MTMSETHRFCNENDNNTYQDKGHQEESCKTKYSRQDHKIKGAVSQSTTLNCNIQICVLSFETVTMENFPADRQLDVTCLSTLLSNR